MLELLPQVEVNQDLYTEDAWVLRPFCHNSAREGCQNHARAPYVWVPDTVYSKVMGVPGVLVAPKALVPILTIIIRIDTHGLPHYIVHCSGLSLFNPNYCTSLLITFRIAGFAYVSSHLI